MLDGFPWRLVTVDIDGTLTRVHGWKEIAKEFHGLAAFESTNRRFAAHEIGEDAHLANLLDIATGHTVADVETVLERTPRLAGIGQGIAAIREVGARVALLTHNPTYVADWYRRTFGFDDSEAVASQSLDHGRIGPPTLTHADKRAGFRALLSRGEISPSLAVHIGDGWSDVEVFRIAGGGVALNSPFAEVNRAADLALATQDFREVAEALARLQPRT